MILEIILVGLVAFATSVLSPFVFRPLLQRYGVVDVPNERSSHSRPTLRAGGLGPLLGWCAGMALVAFLLPSAELIIGVATVTAAALGALGFSDDLFDLPALPRLVIQLAIAIGAAFACGAASGMTELWFVALAGILIVGYVNAANFMDGIDGLSGLHGIVAGGAFALAGWFTGVQWLIFMGVTLGASFAAFLPWNLRKSKFFLGDVGSYLLGGAVAVTAVLALGAGVPTLLILSPLAIYVADTLTTMLRRLVLKERLFSAHRTHVYQRLTDTGMSHIAAASTVTLFQLASWLIGSAVWSSGTAAWFGWAGIGIICAIYLSVPKWRGHRFTLSASGELTEAMMPAVYPARTEFAPRRWVVVGASGFVGSALVAHLRKSEIEHVFEVKAPRLILDPSILDPDSVALAAESSRYRDELAATFADADVVVNAAGLATPDAGGDGALLGANAMLPALIASAARLSGVPRVIHVSSAAVQGVRSKLDDTLDVFPFSPYSRSKALGERTFLRSNFNGKGPSAQTELIVLRATSVQGKDRPTTNALRRVARSWLSSVAAPGDQPSAVSSIDGLVQIASEIGRTRDAVPLIVLQPWEGLSVTEVLRNAGGREPVVLPRWFCMAVVGISRLAGRFMPKIAGASRRVEMMWFGQKQSSRAAPSAFRPAPIDSDLLKRILRDEPMEEHPSAKNSRKLRS